MFVKEILSHFLPILSPSVGRKGLRHLEQDGIVIISRYSQRKVLLVENVLIRGKTSTSSFPPAHAQRMNQITALETKRRESLARHPTRQRCLTPSLASQLLQDTAMPPAPPRCARRRPAGEGAAEARAAVTVVRPAGGPGEDRGVKD